jgi:hypothetical protein
LAIVLAVIPSCSNDSVCYYVYYLDLWEFELTKLLVLVVSKDLTAEEESALFRMLQTVAVPLIGNACHVFMNGFNRVQV